MNACGVGLQVKSYDEFSKVDLATHSLSIVFSDLSHSYVSAMSRDHKVISSTVKSAMNSPMSSIAIYYWYFICLGLSVSVFTQFEHFHLISDGNQTWISVKGHDVFWTLYRLVIYCSFSPICHR